MSTETSGMAARLRQIEESARAALAQRQALVEEAIEILPEAVHLVVPAPRRGRMFLRHGEGHGEFSDVTLTSPLRSGHVSPA